jgi:hypothetical protein
VLCCSGAKLSRINKRQVVYLPAGAGLLVFRRATMSPMVHYPSVAGPHAAASDAAFDISATVFATLSTAASFSPLPFLQEACGLALVLLNTVRVSD